MSSDPFMKTAKLLVEAQVKFQDNVHGPLTVNCAVWPLVPVIELLKVATVTAKAEVDAKTVKDPAVRMTAQASAR
jgi:hypothetical protein